MDTQQTVWKELGASEWLRKRRYKLYIQHHRWMFIQSSFTHDQLLVTFSWRLVSALRSAINRSLFKNKGNTDSICNYDGDFLLYFKRYTEKNLQNVESLSTRVV